MVATEAAHRVRLERGGGAAWRSTHTVPLSHLERPRGAAAVWLVVGFVF